MKAGQFHMSLTDIALGYAAVLLEGHNWWKRQWGYFMRISEPQAMRHPVDRLRAAFAALEFAIHDVNGDDLRRIVNEIGEERISRLVSRLSRSTLDPRRSAGVQSAADRAEARAKSTL